MAIDRMFYTIPAKLNLQRTLLQDCNFNTDLRVTILQRGVSGSEEQFRLNEDRWITRLQTLHPRGMNVRVSAMAETYALLFG
mgnify:CR=1 FL=1